VDGKVHPSGFGKPRHRLCCTTPSGWIFLSPPGTHSKIKIHVLIGQITAFHVFKIYLNTAPAYMSEHFTPGSDIHNYPTRFRVKLNTNLDRSILTYSKMNTVSVVKGFGINSFAYSRCTLWNSLPQYIRDSRTLYSFKSRVKEHFLNLIFKNIVILQYCYISV